MSVQQTEYNLVVTESESLETDEGLQTAVLLSLLTWCRADGEDPVSDPTDLRGWWGDSFADTEGDRFGSKLWIVQNMPASAETLALAKKYTEEALQWMLDDGLVADISVELEIQDRPTGKVLAGRIGLRKPEELAVSFVQMWDVSLNG
jgi:phage gp46-like protein